MDKYIRISREVLLSRDSKINIDLYFRRTTKEGKTEYVLFAKAGLGRIALQKIISNPVGALFIRESAAKEYTEIMESNLESIVGDSKIGTAEKAEVVYDCAIGVIRDVFEDPRSGNNLKRSEGTVSSLVKFSLLEPGAIKSLLSVGQKDYYTFSHCVHVMVFSLGLAKVFGIRTEEHLRILGLGALLHDVGKTKISTMILNKPGKLTPEEFEEIKKHPRHGFEMMTGTLPEPALDIVLHHHEKFNGQGYPDGLGKKDITLFAKIAAMADVYDALTTNRCYAKARNPFEAIMTMKQEMVGHFEEEKFLTFIKMLGPGMQV